MDWNIREIEAVKGMNISTTPKDTLLVQTSGIGNAINHGNPKSWIPEVPHHVSNNAFKPEALLLCGCSVAGATKLAIGL
jgi:hypothetical protein